MNQQLGQKIFIGLDTHRNTIHGTAIDNNGEVICSHNFPNEADAIKEFVKSFHTWNTEIAIEACSLWRGCYKILDSLGYKTRLANPLKCRQIAKEKKTDEVDSKIIADLLRVKYLPEVWIPSEDILQLKDLTRHRICLTRNRVRLQSKIKYLLLRDGIAYEDKIWTREGIKWLNELKSEEIDCYLRLYKTTLKEEDSIKKKITKIARIKEETLLLKTIPGIGEFGAMMIYAEIGNIRRFPNIKHLHAYAGLAPGIQQSGSKTKLPTRKQVNYWLKYIIIECAGRVTLKKSRLQEYYFKIRNKKGWKIARKATARKMMTIVWHVLTNKIPYHES